MKTDRLSLVTPAFGVDEAAEVAHRVDLPTRGSHVSLELAALLRAQSQSPSRLAFPELDSNTRSKDRIDHQTNRGTLRLVGQIHAKEVLEIA